MNLLFSPWRVATLFCSLTIALVSRCPAQTTAAEGPRVLVVDRLGSTPYQSIASIAKIVRPGDTVRLKSDTGPYREMLTLRVSGTKEQPITFDGGNNVVTAFDPVTDWTEKDGVVSCALKTFPCVIAYKGERLVQDATTGKFTKYADLNEAKDTLTLRAGVDKAGWEISKRNLAVGVSDVSHHIYRNVRASGSTNDGFNLHGTGTNLVFENIEGFQNLDEGFSSHDGIECTIRGGKFWGNDNGIANSFHSKDVVSNHISDTDCWNNLGFGLNLHDCSAVLKNVRVWNNDARQLIFNNLVVDCDNVIVYTPKFTTRQLLSYTDSKTTAKMFAYSAGETTVTGKPPKVETTDAPSAP